VQDASKQFHEWAVAEHAAQPAPVQPVAWRWKLGDSGWQLEDAEPSAVQPKAVIEPLYTTPPAAQQAVPLTEPELRAVLEKTNHMITNTMCGPFWPELEQACRAIEAAHGITAAAPEKGNTP
jgi:hypothetical protein